MQRGAVDSAVSSFLLEHRCDIHRMTGDQLAAHRTPFHCVGPLSEALEPTPDVARKKFSFACFILSERGYNIDGDVVQLNRSQPGCRQRGEQVFPRTVAP